VRALFTPGHARDHMCFVLEESGAMFTGDNVLGHGNSVVVENLARYMKSLQVMKRTVQDSKTTLGYPGHGAVIVNLPDKLNVYSRHCETREKVVLAAFVGTNNRTKALTAREITAHLYGAALGTMIGPFIARTLSKLAEEGNTGSIIVGQEKKWFVQR
jgi:hydrolase